MLDPYTLSVVAFIAITAYLVWRDRANIEWQYGILLMRRTERFKATINDIASRWRDFWRALSAIAIVVCFIAMVYGLWLLLSIGTSVAAGLIHAPALQLILPTPGPVGVTGPGYILIPFWFWLLTIATILVPHELAHGIVTRAEKLRLRSVGLLLLAIFPGAFVEPDDRQLKRAPLSSQLRVYAAGSFANFLVAGTLLVLASFILWPALAMPGITLLDVNATGPAGLAGLKTDMVLESVNGTPITTSYSEYMSGRGYLSEETGFLQPNTTLTFASAGHSYDVTLEERNKTAYMGILYMPNMRGDEIFLLATIFPLLTMLWLFSFAVGLFNILPLPALDGGLMIKAVAERVTRKYGRTIARAIGLAVLALILYDFIGPLLA